MKKIKYIYIVLILTLLSLIFVGNNKLYAANKYNSDNNKGSWSVSDITTNTINGVTHSLMHGTSTDANESTTGNQLVNMFEMKTDGVNSKLVTWAISGKTTYSRAGLSAIAKDYEKTHPGWIVVAGINGDQYYTKYGDGLGTDGSFYYYNQPYYPMVIDGERRFAITPTGGSSRNYVGIANNGNSNSMVAPSTLDGLKLEILNEKDEVIYIHDVDKVNQTPDNNEVTVWVTYNSATASGETVEHSVSSNKSLYIVESAEQVYMSNSVTYTHGGGADALFARGTIDLTSNNYTFTSCTFGIETILFTVNKGWNFFTIPKANFGGSRNPLGWDKITTINITNSGWSQSPNKNANLYFSEFTFIDNADYASPIADSKLENAAVFTENGFYCGIDGNIATISDDGNTETVVFVENGVYYLPVGSLAAVKGDYGTYYPDEGVISFYYNGATYVFTAGQKYYTVNGERKDLNYAPKTSGRALFIADVDAMSVFGYSQKYVDRMGLIALSNTADLFDADMDFEFIYDLIEEMIYVRPDGEEIVSTLNANTSGQHPYLMVDADGFDRLRYYFDMDPTMQGYVAKLESKYGIGSNEFKDPVNRYGLTDGVRLLSTSRDVMNKTISWAFLAKIYEKSDPERAAQYAERIWIELEAAANFKDSAVVFTVKKILRGAPYSVTTAKAVLSTNIADLNFNSQKLSDFYADCEKSFKVSLPKSVTDSFVTVADLCNYLDSKAAGKYSWHPAHFLDVGELGYPFGICYDWLYDYWVDTNDNINVKNAANDQLMNYSYEEGATRLSILEDAMFWMGLSVTSALPSDTTGKYVDGGYNLGGSTNNWNGVCNGGLMAAALAICNVDRYAEDIKDYLDVTITGIERGMWVYAPEGGYEEGPGYWSYGTTYAHIFMSCLQSACGTTYGLYNAPGFAHSVYFTTYLGSANTTWGFHDGGSGSADTNIAAWFALMSNDPNVNAIRRQAIDMGWKSVSMYDVIYFDPHIMTSTITLDLDSYYSLDSIMTFRSSWDTSNNIFTGLHGGDNAASHGDLDIGNFVINVNGVFIIGELGSDNYNTAGYFGVYRWSYYRKRAEGQNTLVMIPSASNTDGNGWNGKTGIPCIVDEVKNTAGTTNQPTPDQIKNAISEVLRYETGANSAIGVVEMAPAFNEMTEGIRGLYFTDNRSTIVIQDEAVFSEAMDIWWFAHTQGTITVSEDGKTAIIERSGIMLYAEIVTNMDADVKFSVMAAESLDKNYVGDTTKSEYYSSDYESDRSGFSKLAVTVEDATELKLAVVFRVIESPADAPEIGTTYQWQDIAEWKVD